MPRAQSQTGSSAGSSSQTPLLLKRNQACHQCRRRKLRCDAQRPCSTCVRSHRFAAASNPALLTTEPECTYDDLASDGTPVVKPRTKYKALEDRIGELEDLLKQQLVQNTDPRPASNATTGPSTTQPLSEPTLPDNPTIVISESDLFNLGNHFEVSPNPSQGQASTPSTHSRETASVDTSQQLLASNWPPLLPRPELLHHLVDVFFNCHPHGRYLLHRPSFMISLTLSPKTTNFPHVSLLHAICAYAGVFSYLVEPPPGPDLKNLGHDFIFGEQRLGTCQREASFSEYHARLAEETLEESLSAGFNMLECTQASAILTGFYHMQGRWVDLWTASAHFFRLAVPLGLPARIGYRADGTVPDPSFLPDGTESLLPEATSPIEREQRVNLLWIGYANDRFVSAPASWALSIDDQDIHQVFPCDLSRFEAGYGIDHEGSRQSMDSPDVLFKHFPETTDSFTLYLKGAILISKTKTFNQRIRHKHPDVKDIRELPEFHQLEKEINMFKKSFPLRYQSPITETSRGLDVHVYTAHLMPHYATLWLHERLKDNRSPNCLSVQKATTAARAVLDLVYAVCSTNFDITRLPIVCPHAWHKAGSTLVNLFKLELSRGKQEEALAIDMEIQAIRFALGQMGSRIPMALRYNNSLDFDIHQGQISQLNYSMSRQSLPSDQASKSHLSPSTTSSKSPGMKSPNGGSHEEIRTFTSFTSSPAEQNLFTETSLFAPGATRVDGSLLPLLDPEPAPTDGFVSFGSQSF